MIGKRVRSLFWHCLAMCGMVGLPAAAIGAAEGCHPSLEAAAYESDVTGPHLIFPQTHLFHLLVADLKEPRFFLGYRRDERSDGSWDVRVVGFGETFPLYRRLNDCAANGWQLDVSGGGVARFDMDSRDLIDADYLIALPLSWRRGDWALRSRILHESAHRGENKRINEAVATRNKRSTDSVDLIASYAREKWRLYGGAEYVWHQYPEIDPWGVHLGVEYYGPRSLLWGTARWVTGIDGKAWQEFDYDADISIKTGLSFGGERLWQHHLQIMLEWYEGHANSGVFFEEEIRYLGAGIYFGF